jgi:hypothetical protein
MKSILLFKNEIELKNDHFSNDKPENEVKTVGDC